MRRLVFPEVSFTRIEPDGDKGIVVPITAAEQLEQVVTFPPPEVSLSLDEIRKRVPLADKLRKARRSKQILLEEVEWETLQRAFGQTSWRAATASVVALADAIAGAKTIEVKENRASRRRKKQS